ncbi:MAG: hypothetical protein R3C53_14085 [Pirellulaceae bacterium]
MRFTSWKKWTAVAVCFSIGCCSWMSLGHAADEEAGKAKYSIKQVMKEAHKKGDSLLEKVIAGDASAEEKTKLLDLYISLVENEPKKGEAASWQKLAGGAALAAAKVVVGREGATDELKKAADCAGCHKPHK